MTKTRFDVWTDAGRKHGDLYLIVENAASTVAYTMHRWLQAEGWTSEIRETVWTIGSRRRLR